MTELEKMQRAQMYIDKMANGINPLDETSVADDDLINNVRISRCLFYVSDILKQVIENGGNVSRKKEKKAPFNITPKQIQSFSYSDTPLTVSEIARRIDEIANDGSMKRFSYKYITDFLISTDLLKSVTKEDGKKEKRPTPSGMSMGIITEKRINDNGEYNIVLYNETAQHFIIDNIYAIIEIGNEIDDNHGRAWSEKDTKTLIDLYQKDTTIAEIALVLKRTRDAIRSRLKKLGYTV